MYILIDLNRGLAYYSVRIGGFRRITKRCTRTMNKWIGNQDNKSGYALYMGERITTRRGARL